MNQQPKEFCKLEDYIKTEKIGSGSYGVVFKGIHKKTGEIVAMKKVHSSDENGIPHTTIREISLLRDLKHPNIVELQEIFISEHKIYLVFEFMEMDLSRHLKQNSCGLDSDLVKSYTYQIFQAILYCHQRRIMHRDLKPANLLINSTGCIKVADLGCARSFGIPIRILTHEVVTLYYRAPEILLGSSHYGCPIDLWSIGTIFAEMTTGWPLFVGDSEIDQLFQIFKILGTPSEQTWPSVTTLPDFKDCFPRWNENTLKEKIGSKLSSPGLCLISQLLVLDPRKRISAKEALHHFYFSDLDKSCLPAKSEDCV